MKSLRTQSDLGLLVLRGEALLLLIVYGWKKFTWLFPLISGRVAWSSWGFAAQIGKMGFPLPIALAVFVVLCESVGALFIVLGFFTRVSAALTTLSMAPCISACVLAKRPGTWRLYISSHSLALLWLAQEGSRLIRC